MTPFEYTPYYSFALTLEEVTNEAIQDVCRQAYLKMLLNPKYIFLSLEDHWILQEAHRAKRIEWGLEDSKNLQLLAIMNETTGRLMHLITLPGAEAKTIIFGFITN